MRKYLFICYAFVLFNLSSPMAMAGLPGFNLHNSTITQQTLQRQVRKALRPTLRIDKQQQAKVLAFDYDTANHSLSAISKHAFAAWDLDTGLASVWHSAEAKPLLSAKLSAAGRHLLLQDTELNVRVIRLSLDNRVEHSIKINERLVDVHALAEQSAWLAIGESGQLIHIDAENMLSQISLDSEQRALCCLAGSGRQVLVATPHAVHLLDANNNFQISRTWQTADSVQALMLSADGASLAVVGASQLHLLESDLSGVRWSVQKPASTQMLGLSTTNWVGVNGDKWLSYALADGAWQAFSVDDFDQRIIQGAVINHMLVVAAEDGLIYGINLDTQKIDLRLLLTDYGWVTIDREGRFDGLADAVASVDWEAKGIPVNLANFSKQYYEPGLLKKLFSVSQQSLITQNARDINEGIYLPPEVLIRSVKKDRVFENAMVVEVLAKLAYNTRFDDIGSARLFVNGKRLADSHLLGVDKDNKAKTIVWKFNVPLHRESNQLIAEVSSWNDIVASSEPYVVAGQDKALADNTSIVGIGINDYASDRLKLNYSVADAQAIAAEFSQVLKRAVKSHSSALMLNEQATASDLRKNLAALKSATANDTVIFYLSGHGVAVADHWYFLPQEASHLDDPGYVKRVGISGQELADALVNSPAQNIFLAIDACQSGAVLNDFALHSQQKTIQQLSDDTGVHILTATRADQLAPEFDRLGHGLFTYVLLHGLKHKQGRYLADKWPADGKLSINELERYVMHNSPILAKFLFQQAQGREEQRGVETTSRVVVQPSRLSSKSTFFLN